MMIIYLQVSTMTSYVEVMAQTTLSGDGIDEVKDYNPEKGDVIFGKTCETIRNFP
jgi:hypothetical protein